MNFSKRFYALAFLMMLSLPLTVIADEETEEVVRMEEVVVTARKREQRSFEVPPLRFDVPRGEIRYYTLVGDGYTFFVESHAEFADGVVVWTHFSTFLYPWSR